MRTRSSSTTRTSEAARLSLAALGVALLAFPALAGEGKAEARPAAKLKVLKVWASDEAEKGSDRTADAELKDYRKKLEEKTGKKSFSIEGKVAIEEAVPGKTLKFPLVDEYRLEITPVATPGKKAKESVSLQISLYQGKVEKRRIECPPALQIIHYCAPIRKEGREMVVIVHKLPAGK